MLKIKSNNFGCASCKFLMPSNEDMYNFCCEGHMICPECISQAQGYCPLEHDSPNSHPVCKYKYPLYRAICQAGVYTCVNEERGCQEKLSFTNFEAHVKKNCLYRESRVCFVSGCYDTSEDRLKHLQASHTVKIREANDQDVALLYKRPEKKMKFFDGPMQWISTIFRMENDHFALALKEHNDKLKLWLFAVDPKIKRQNYSATINIHLEATQEDKEFPVEILADDEDPDVGMSFAELPNEDVESNLCVIDEFPGSRFLNCGVNIEKNTVEDFEEICGNDAKDDPKLNVPIGLESMNKLLDTAVLEIDKAPYETGKTEEGASSTAEISEGHQREESEKDVIAVETTDNQSAGYNTYETDPPQLPEEKEEDQDETVDEDGACKDEEPSSSNDEVNLLDEQETVPENVSGRRNSGLLSSFHDLFLGESAHEEAEADEDEPAEVNPFSVLITNFSQYLPWRKK